MADVADEGYSDGKLANLALETLEALHDDGKPFFLAVGFFKPHLPFNAPKKYWDLYDPEIFSLDNEIKRVSGAPDPAYHSHRELGGYIDMPEDEQLDAGQTRMLRHGYYACISYVDTQIGKLLDKLEELGESDNTIVVLWGDHGFALGEANRWCKGTNFELDTRVPLIIRTPGMKHPGRQTDALVEMVDLYPTLTDLAGLKTPWHLDGSSMRPVLQDPAAAGKSMVRSQFARPFSKLNLTHMGYSIRTGQFRYGRWLDFKTREILAEELYDYSNPDSVQLRKAYRNEQANIVGDPSMGSVLQDMRQQMDQYLASLPGQKVPAE